MHKFSDAFIQTLSYQVESKSFGVFYSDQKNYYQWDLLFSGVGNTNVDNRRLVGKPYCLQYVELVLSLE